MLIKNTTKGATCNMLIRLAEEHEFAAVRSFYHQVIDLMESAQYKPGWEKDIYPSRDYLQKSISNKELYVGTADGQIMAAMVVNHNFNESYSNVTWPVKADAGEVMVIHILCVHPGYSGKGYAKQLVQTALEIAAQSHQKAVRLDVLKGNVPAERLYTGIGFQYINTIRMFYEDTDWTDFLLYEYPLPAKL